MARRRSRGGGSTQRAQRLAEDGEVPVRPERRRRRARSRSASTAATRARDGGDPSDEPDVLLDVPVVKVDSIHLELDDLDAHVALKAQVLDLVKLNVGVDVHLGRVVLDIKGVEAQALLKVRLDHVAAIVDRVLTTLDRNPSYQEPRRGRRGRRLGRREDARRDRRGGRGRRRRRRGRRPGRRRGRRPGGRRRRRGRRPGRRQIGEGAGQAVGDVGEGAGQARRRASARAPARRSATSARAPARRSATSTRPSAARADGGRGRPGRRPGGRRQRGPGSGSGSVRPQGATDCGQLGQGGGGGGSGMAATGSAGRRPASRRQPARRPAGSSPSRWPRRGQGDRLGGVRRGEGARARRDPQGQGARRAPPRTSAPSKHNATEAALRMADELGRRHRRGRGHGAEGRITVKDVRRPRRPDAWRGATTSRRERPDVEMGAVVKAKSLRFKRVPETDVDVPGDRTADAESGSERENLPDEVEPGVTYRDVRVRWRRGRQAPRGRARGRSAPARLSPRLDGST